MDEKELEKLLLEDLDDGSDAPTEEELFANCKDDDSLVAMATAGATTGYTPFKIRTAKPTKKDKFAKNYIVKGNGGWSWCILGNPKDKECDVLSNCVGYANGRFNEIYNEIMGTTGAKYYALNCKAKLFIDRAKKTYPDLVISDKPTPGAILVMGHATKSGHVIMVEEVINDKKFKSSESSYNGKAFYSKIREYNKGHWGMSDAYYQIGFIQNPAVTESKKVTPPVEENKYKDQILVHSTKLRCRTLPSLEGEILGYVEDGAYYNYDKTEAGDGYTWYRIAEDQWCANTGTIEVIPKTREPQIGDEVVLEGPLYRSSNAEKPVSVASRRNTVVTRFAEGALHPYNTKGDLGWCDASSLTVITPVKPDGPDYKTLYNINVEPNRYCTITVEKAKALPNSIVQVYAEPSKGYKITSLTANGIEIENYSFVMPAADVIIKATVEKVLYNIFVTGCEFGRVATNKVFATVGEAVYVTVLPEEHYKAVEVTVTNATPMYDSEGNIYFIMPASNVTVSATFEPVVQSVYHVGDRVLICKPGNSEPNGSGFVTFNVNCTAIVSKVEWTPDYTLAEYCYQLRDLDGNILGYYKAEDLTLETQLPDQKFYIGQSVKILRKGNSRPDGTGYAVFGIGWEKQVLDYIPNAEYKYKIGRSSWIDVVQGYYKEEDLEKI